MVNFLKLSLTFGCAILCATSQLEAAQKIRKNLELKIPEQFRVLDLGNETLNQDTPESAFKYLLSKIFDQSISFGLTMSVSDTQRTKSIFANSPFITPSKVDYGNYYNELFYGLLSRLPNQVMEMPKCQFDVHDNLAIAYVTTKHPSNPYFRKVFALPMIKLEGKWKFSPSSTYDGAALPFDENLRIRAHELATKAQIKAAEQTQEINSKLIQEYQQTIDKHRQHIFSNIDKDKLTDYFLDAIEEQDLLKIAAVIKSKKGEFDEASSSLDSLFSIYNYTRLKPSTNHSGSSYAFASILNKHSIKVALDQKDKEIITDKLPPTKDTTKEFATLNFNFDIIARNTLASLCQIIAFEIEINTDKKEQILDVKGLISSEQYFLNENQIVSLILKKHFASHPPIYASSPEEAVEQFLNAIVASDFSTILRLINITPFLIDQKNDQKEEDKSIEKKVEELNNGQVNQHLSNQIRKLRDNYIYTFPLLSNPPSHSRSSSNNGSIPLKSKTYVDIQPNVKIQYALPSDTDRKAFVLVSYSYKSANKTKKVTMNIPLIKLEKGWQIDLYQ